MKSRGVSFRSLNNDGINTSTTQPDRKFFFVVAEKEKHNQILFKTV